MVGEGHVLVTHGGHGGDHLLQRELAVTPVAVEVEVTPEVGLDYQVRQAAFPGGVQLVSAAADLIRNRWQPEPVPTWITFVPSRRNPGLVADFAEKLAAALNLPCEPVIVKVRDTEPQKTMQNSFGQYRNVRNAFEVRGAVLSGPVLLVDDVVDSRWTFTAIGGMLRAAGSGAVFPFALADAAGRSAT